MKFKKCIMAAVFSVLLCIPLYARDTGEIMETSRDYKTLGDVPEKVWNALSRKNIYFGHQSVGYNIMNGLQAVLEDNPKIGLKIIENYDPDGMAGGVFAHSRLGYNWDPASKTQAFSFLMKAGMAQKADIAFHKYCYVDMRHNSDVEQIFANYQKNMESIHNTYPDLLLIHVTLPLTTIQTGIKAKIKTLLGKSPAGMAENIKRYQFNEKLKATFGKDSLIFDLAEVESTYPDGSRAVFEKDGKKYPHLIKDYASDNGHLNEQGRRRAAEKLLLFFANHIPLN